MYGYRNAQIFTREHHHNTERGFKEVKCNSKEINHPKGVDATRIPGSRHSKSPRSNMNSITIMHSNALLVHSCFPVPSRVIPSIVYPSKLWIVLKFLRQTGKVRKGVN